MSTVSFASALRSASCARTSAPDVSSRGIAGVPPAGLRQTSRAHSTVALRRSLSVISKAASAPVASGTSEKDQRYFWRFALPLSPISKRKTLREEVVKKTVWTFDQLQGTLAVLVNVRMTVVALKGGGLWVYNPVAPTPECVRELRHLEALYGDVKYIVLGTYAVEHKVFLGPFARKFMEAQVWVTPYQWSYPVNLPIGFLGIFPRKANIIPEPEDSSELPWADEFEHAILGPIDIGLGPFVEVAFNHKSSGTLILTESVVEVPSTPPAICLVDPFPLLYHARQVYSDPLKDTPQERAAGWAKTVLFALYLQPVAVELISTVGTLRNWLSSETFPGVQGFFPFNWPEAGYRQAFARVSDRLLVPPILENFIMNRGPTTVITWADQVARFKFNKIIPSHFKAPIATNPREFRAAIDVAVRNSTRTSENFTPPPPPQGVAGLLQRLPGKRRGVTGLPDEDMVILRNIDKFFVDKGISLPRGTLE